MRKDGIHLDERLMLGLVDSQAQRAKYVSGSGHICPTKVQQSHFFGKQTTNGRNNLKAVNQTKWAFLSFFFFG